MFICYVWDKKNCILFQNRIEPCPAEKVYHWEESENEIVVEENIGKGGFGQVFKGEKNYFK